MSGYLDARYAASFSGSGTPIRLPRSGGWLLLRDIPGTGLVDAAGLYPLLCCEDWAGLFADLAELDGVVSVTAVPDPFGTSDDLLHRSFPDLLRPYKPYHVLDLALPFESVTSKHHRYYARRAARSLDVEFVPRPLDFLEIWSQLYGNLVDRHSISGMADFSSAAFSLQFAVDGLHLVVARADEKVVAAHLWYEQGGVAYSHLAASSDVGYGMGAQYALHAAAVHHFRPRVRWLSLGGTPDNGGDGLDAFKRGWASEQRMSMLAGRICDPGAYHGLLQGHAAATAYFPSYRALR